MAEVRPIIPAAVAYTRTAIALHWLAVVLIASGFALGTWMVDLPIAPQTLRVYAYHKWIGITVLLVTLARPRVAFCAPRAACAGLPVWQRRAAVVSHVALYALMIAIPVSGWFFSSASGVQVVYLGTRRAPNLVAKDDALAAVLKSVHYTLNFALLVLVLVHAGAALRHHFVQRDSVLARMLLPHSTRHPESP
jgi:cytochrome b561